MKHLVIKYNYLQQNGLKNQKILIFDNIEANWYQYQQFMDIDIDSSLFELERPIDFSHCANCHKKDEMIQKYVRLVALYRQKVKINCLRSRTLSQGWFEVRSSKKETINKKLRNTVDTNFTWKEQNQGERLLGRKVLHEESQQQSSASQIKDNFQCYLQRQANQKIQELKSFMAHIRKALDINNLQKIKHPKINTQHFKALVNVLISSFEFDDEEKLFIYHHCHRFQTKNVNQKLFGWLGKFNSKMIQNRSQSNSQGRLNRISKIFGFTF